MNKNKYILICIILAFIIFIYICSSLYMIYYLNNNKKNKSIKYATNIAPTNTNNIAPSTNTNNIAPSTNTNNIAPSTNTNNIAPTNTNNKNFIKNKTDTTTITMINEKYANIYQYRDSPFYYSELDTNDVLKQLYDSNKNPLYITYNSISYYLVVQDNDLEPLKGPYPLLLYKYKDDYITPITSSHPTPQIFQPKYVADETLQVVDYYGWIVDADTKHINLDKVKEICQSKILPFYFNGINITSEFKTLICGSYNIDYNITVDLVPYIEPFYFSKIDNKKIYKQLYYVTGEPIYIDITYPNEDNVTVYLIINLSNDMIYGIIYKIRDKKITIYDPTPQNLTDTNTVLFYGNIVDNNNNGYTINRIKEVCISKNNNFIFSAGNLPVTDIIKNIFCNNLKTE